MKTTSVIKLGTSGYSYHDDLCDWRGSFYPRGMVSKDFLAYYAQEFSAVELNSTYYRWQPAQFFERLSEKVPSGFEFSVKCWGRISHERDQVDESTFQAIKDGLSPLKEKGMLSALLIQFPASFMNTPQNRDYLKHISEELDELPLVIEYRSVSWHKKPVFDWMESQNIAFCSVDEPELPGLLPREAISTSRVLSYVRFHGRNKEAWYNQKGNPHLRYNWDYTEEELLEWKPKIEQLSRASEKVIIFFNNCYRGQAIESARRMREILGLERIVREPVSAQEELFS